ncbi:hypothetical protein J0X19_06400 [Hymenobacter sp. BT186]|uniref:Uncharacterized protein n=1 Tax=Hymenobacter telluris TaxID=2816474 RepID=A0A939EU51_9BACT|nr:hypothetical protein [Hymenobacter telluris]MBO0357570.1 hypothetical protein [Hymenobacter telluris]MBW3373596.1 hypothetical protein [Hymenobacter norwichensis]
MNEFNNLVGREILKIHRLDSEIDYYYYSPYAIIFTINGITEKFIISIANNRSIDLKISNYKQIADDYGLEFNECILNDINKQDELNLFIGESIKHIRLARYNSLEIQGTGFVIQQGEYAGVELQTDTHTLLFQNKYNGDGWCDIDDELAQIHDKDRWHWL